MDRAALAIFACGIVTGCFVDRSGFAGQDAGWRPSDDGGSARDASLDGASFTFDAAARDDGAVPDAGRPVDGSCDRSTFIAICDEDDRVECVGGMLARVSCPLGCVSGRCRGLVPSNVGLRVAMDSATGALDVIPGETLLIDTDTGEIVEDDLFGRTIRHASAGEGLDPDSGIRYVRLPSDPAGGADLGVFVVASLHIPGTGRVNVRGDRAFVLLVGGNARIEGTLDVSSDDQAGGPGGGAGGEPESVGTGLGAGQPGSDASAKNDSGGGGGAFGSAGGDGGRASGGAGGSPYGAAELQPLVGGSGGGGGGDDDGGAGGGVGGAVQISVNGTLRVSGTIDASGGGGEGGSGVGVIGDRDSGAGGGGGSGGAILLEAQSIALTGGTLAANGGAGGQGATCSGGSAGCAFLDGESGADGDASIVPAPGSYDEGNGGGGGAGSDVSGSAGAGGRSAQNGGGGGGGAGRIRVNTPSGSGAYAGVNLSPAAGSGLATEGPLGSSP